MTTTSKKKQPVKDVNEILAKAYTKASQVAIEKAAQREFNVVMAKAIGAIVKTWFKQNKPIVEEELAKAVDESLNAMRAKKIQELVNNLDFDFYY